MQSKVHVSRSNRAFLSPTRENGSLRKARFERETWTYFALLYLHNGRGKNQRSAEINSDTHCQKFRTSIHVCTLKTHVKYLIVLNINAVGLIFKI